MKKRDNMIEPTEGETPVVAEAETLDEQVTDVADTESKAELEPTKTGGSQATNGYHSLEDACKKLGVKMVTLLHMINRGDVVLSLDKDGNLEGVFL